MKGYCLRDPITTTITSKLDTTLELLFFIIERTFLPYFTERWLSTMKRNKKSNPSDTMNSLTRVSFKVMHFIRYSFSTIKYFNFIMKFQLFVFHDSILFMWKYCWGFLLVLFSIYLKPVCFRESTHVWRSFVRWQKNILGKIVLVVCFSKILKYFVILYSASKYN